MWSFLERFYKLSVPETIIEEEKFLQNDQENLDGIDINNENNTDVITDDEIHAGWDNDYENTTWESFEKKDLRGVPLFRVPVPPARPPPSGGTTSPPRNWSTFECSPAAAGCDIC